MGAAAKQNEAPGGEEILDAERRLALAYVDSRSRTALEALWRLDATLGQALRAASQPIVAQMKLAWWRDALLGLDGQRAPAEPMLRAIQACLPTWRIAGPDLVPLVDGWEQLAGAEQLTPDVLAAYALGRGGTLFRISAIALDGAAIPGLDAAGRCWALVDLARHVNSAGERGAALAAALQESVSMPGRWPSALRPLTMLAVLARQDAASEELAQLGSPRRMLRMLIHRLSGR